MTPKCIVILGLAFGIAAFPARGWQLKHVSAKKTFTSTKADFQFQYPDWFVDCAHASDEGGRSCAGVCSGTRTSEGSIFVCVAYPESRVGEGTNFAGAAFVVDEFKDARDGPTCNNIVEADTKSHTEKINGVSFTVAEAGGAAGGTASGATVYRTFRNHTCYELDINTAAVNLGNYDPPERPKQYDDAPVRKDLNDVLTTFKFLR
jgi:hypothetical protein